MSADLPFDLYDLNWLTISFRVVLSVLVGGIIGTERDIKNRAAGMRTHMLVCLGAAIVMMTNQYVVGAFPDMRLDVTRMGAQVISGIGFLGAGTILVTRNNRVRGLTTAAGLWAAATIGLAIGIGFYEIAIVGILAILVIMVILRPVKRFVQDKTDQSTFRLLIYLKGDLHELLEFMSDKEVEIVNMTVDKEKGDDENIRTIVQMTIELGPDAHKEDFVKYLKQLAGVSHIIEMDED